MCVIDRMSIHSQLSVTSQRIIFIAFYAQKVKIHFKSILVPSSSILHVRIRKLRCWTAGRGLPHSPELYRYMYILSPYWMKSLSFGYILCVALDGSLLRGGEH